MPEKEEKEGMEEREANPSSPSPSSSEECKEISGALINMPILSQNYGMSIKKFNLN